MFSKKPLSEGFFAIVAAALCWEQELDSFCPTCYLKNSEERMFTFFRRYQRAIYFVITAVIIFSFSFFGTYSAFTSGKGEDLVVFCTEDGTRVTRSDFNDYMHFLSMDSLSLGEGGGILSNPLNDGVLANDIVATGIGEVLARRFSTDFQGDWKLKLGRERLFQPYRHPQASFVSAMQVWSYFAPDLKESFEKFRSFSSENPVEIYQKKASLFLAERQFPSVFLRQILTYQQQQFNWIEPDISLEGRPLGLFGYSQISDWFGVPFVDKSIEFIIQTASRARAAGLSVSSGEALASLYQNAQRALQKLPQKNGMTADDLFRKTLREFNMDQSRAIAIWSDVLLFRRSLIELPLNIVVNRQPFEEYLLKESEACDLDCYQLQPALRPTSMRDLFKIELWLNGVADRQQNANASLLPPSKFKSLEAVVESWPEFVERRFILGFSSVTFDDLVKNIRLRDIWNWEVDNDNWDQLIKEIPALGEKEASDRESRLKALDRLSPQLRAKADTTAKEHIVALHPQWLQELLSKAKMESQVVNIRLQGGKLPFEGVNDRQALIAELQKAPIGEIPPSLQNYTQDGKNFYRIQVYDRALTDSLAPLPDLLADGTLDHVLDRLVEMSYPKIRGERPADYRKEGGEWKPFQEVKEKVGEAFFADLIKRLDHAIEEWRVKLPKFCHWDDLKSARVAVRFLPQLSLLSQKIEVEGDWSVYVTSPFVSAGKESVGLIIEERPLTDLWLLVASKQRVVRYERGEKIQFAEALSSEPGVWMPPRYSQEFGPFVAKVTKKDIEAYEEDLRAMMLDSQRFLGREAIQARSQLLVIDFFGEPKKE
jgi:GcvH upstream region-like protein